ncbi:MULTISPECIES: Glu-tRNA(Gln) amidotransferase subunit GatE [Metallosphaera]|uniref:Glu-tRNA(Gln) amidotransferase subunit GatE n=1 Tax=Metallosphaera TaxID=41980 RepID=UPI001F05B519|nr:Glu-tRNA(Gln) amidotransferase subunit GatE [Metallosphaera sedula]MCH1771332.1 Glu-tRNA(Gln) amidotransferase subunit GatE [Metallosphaera sedula]MCP6729722.1 Glu-tRNA(Gln) amidotransferase subunit GatE [Metallosphaera sedula]
MSEYEKMGLKVGLEIHQQINTSHKLFCECPTTMDEESQGELERYLRPVASELGQIDVAAFFEWEKGKKVVYEVPRRSSCLVECDEEPPHPMNLDAIKLGLAMTLAFNGEPLDEIFVMRKTVIDGSNTSGFQRTAIVGLGGYIKDADGVITIQTIAIEEDAARKLEETPTSVKYNLDRLGIPLIEISTGPDIRSPEQAKRVALLIGQMLRLTGKVKRGLGTIRQDLNVSIVGGVKTEIKGVQDLDMIPKIIENEANRQRELLRIRDELRARITREDFIKKVVEKDLTELFTSSRSRLIQSELKKGGKVLGLLAPGFKGLLGRQVMPGRRFGTEVSDYVKALAGLGGIFHSDELPNYGIVEEEVQRVAKELGVGELDAFILVVGPEEKVKKAIQVIKERLSQAFEGVPKETRAANEDGTSKFMRPQPGSARMYPETDIPSILSRELLEDAKKMVPPTPEQKLKELMKMGLNEELAKQVLNSPRLDQFEYLTRKYVNVSPTVIATTLENTLKYVKSQGGNIDKISDGDIEAVIASVSQGKITKDSIPQILLEYSAPNSNVGIKSVISRYTGISEEELINLIKEIVAQNSEEVKSKGEKAFSLLMGKVMERVRGRAEGKKVAELIRKVMKDETG